MASEGDRRTTNRLLSGPNIPLGWCGATWGCLSVSVQLWQSPDGSTDPDEGF